MSQLRDLERSIVHYEIIRNDLSERLLKEQDFKVYQLIIKQVNYCDKMLDRLYEKFEKVVRYE